MYYFFIPNADIIVIVVENILENFTLLPKHCRITNRLNFLATNMLNQTLNVSSVARYLGISSSSIFRRLNDVKFPKPSILPHVLSIDEFKGNANGEKFQAILTDPKIIRFLTFFHQELSISLKTIC